MKSRLVLVAILFGVLLSRLAWIGAPSAWTDEALTYRLIQQPLAVIFETILQQDSSPPLSYMLFGLWGKIGHSLGFIRALSALFSAAGAALLFWLIRSMISKRAAIFGVLYFAATPLAMAWGRQVRYPAMLAFFCLAATVILFEYVKKPDGKKALLYSVFALCAAYTHYLAFLVFAAHIVILILNRKAVLQKRRTLFPALVICVFGYAPWLVVALSQLQARAVADSGLSFSFIEFPLAVLSWSNLGWSLWHLPAGISDMIPVSFLPAKIDILILASPFILFLVAGIWGKWKSVSEKHSALALAILPLLIFWMMQAWTTLFAPQYLLIFLPYLILPMAAFWERCAGKSRRLALLATMILMVPLIVGNAKFIGEKGAGENWKALALSLKKHGKHGDIILLPNDTAEVCLEIYLGKMPNVQVVMHGSDPGGNVDKKTADAVVSQIAKKASRIWYVGYYPMRYDRLGMIDRALAANAFQLPLPKEIGKRFSDSRLSLKLFSLEKETVAQALPREIPMDHPGGLLADPIANGIYSGDGDLLWTARKFQARIFLPMKHSACVEGFAPAEIYRKSSVDVDFQVAPYPRDGDAPDIFPKQTRFLFGMFLVCFDAGDYSGGVTIEAECHDSFIPDELFNDGDQDEKCLQLRRIWAEPVTAHEK